MHHIPETGFLRLYQIVGDRSKNIPAVIPVSRSTWLAGVKSGIYPAPVKHGRSVFWKAEDIRALIKSIGGEA